MQEKTEYTPVEIGDFFRALAEVSYHAALYEDSSEDLVRKSQAPDMLKKIIAFRDALPSNVRANLPRDITGINLDERLSNLEKKCRKYLAR